MASVFWQYFQSHKPTAWPNAAIFNIQERTGCSDYGSVLDAATMAAYWIKNKLTQYITLPNKKVKVKVAIRND
jgi:hypothetical protein